MSLLLAIAAATATMPLKWFTWYDYSPGQPGNLASSTNLTLLDEVHAATGRHGLWDIGDGMCGQPSWCNGTATANDSTPCGKVWNEPFCGPSGSKKGVSADWKAEVDKIAALEKQLNTVKEEKHHDDGFSGDALVIPLA